MNFIENTRREFQICLLQFSTIKVWVLPFVVVALIIVIQLATPYVASISPFLAVILSWCWFILPGVLLSFVILKDLYWLERIPVSFVLSIGLFTPLTIIAILSRVELDDYVSFIIGAQILIVITYLAQVFLSKRTREDNLPFNPEIQPVKFDAFSITLLVFVIFISCILAFLAFQWPPTGDDISALPIFGDVLRLDQITGSEPFHGSDTSSTPRNELIAWIYMNILTCRISGTEPIDYFVASRPVLVFLALLALYTFLNQFFKNKRLALYILSLWCIYLLTTTHSEGTGNDLITRILQDKFAGWFIVVPIVLVFMQWFLETSEWKYLACFGLVAFGAALVHPITLTQVMIICGGFGLMHLAINRSWRVFFNLSLVALILLLCIALPIIQYVRFTSYMPVKLAGLGEAVEFARLSQAVRRYRLWMLEGDRYVLHPRIISQPLIIVAYLLLFIPIIKLWRSYAARLIVGSMLVLPLIFYLPPLAGIVGRFVTPYLMWRLAWPFPLFAILIIGWCAWLITLRLRGVLEKITNNAVIHYFLTLSLLIVVVLINWKSVEAGLINYNERKSQVNLSTCIIADDVLTYLDKLTYQKPANVLASRFLNFCIPGYAALANVVEYRGFNTVNRLPIDEIDESIQRVEDSSYFSVTTLVDDIVVAIIERYDIDYVLVEKERLDLDLQFKYLSSLFTPVYADSNFSLYAVKRPLVSSRIIDGNAALRQRRWNIASEIFEQILIEDPAQVLAYAGKGLAQEGRGEMDLALEAYQEAVYHAQHEAALHARLAGTYLLNKELEKATDEYMIATKLAPERYALHDALGRIYFIAGREHEAQTSFERAASLRTSEGTASYYTIIGRMMQLADWNTGATKNYQKAIIIEPDPSRLVLLAQSLEESGRVDDAVQAYKSASQLDRWNYFPHLKLGLLLQSQGRLDEAILEYDKACRLNPTKVSSFILLGQAVQKKSGFASAISYLDRYAYLNEVLPGPYRGKAALYFANGEIETALQMFDLSSKIQPSDASIQAAKGFMLMAEGQLSDAQRAFDKALFLNPNLIFARLGLSMLYTSQFEYGLDTGQYLQVARLEPAEAWPHLYLAEAYQRQGKLEDAQEEIGWVLKLEPSNVAGYLASGDLNRSRAQWQNAILDYQNVLKLEPDSPEALLYLGDVYQALGDFSTAEDLYKQAVRVDREFAVAYTKLADMYWQLSRIDESTIINETAAEVAPNSVPILLNLANNYRLQGKTEEALEIYEKTIQINSATIAAYAAMAQLEGEENFNPETIQSIYQTALVSNPESSHTYLTAGRFFMLQGYVDKAESAFLSGLNFLDVTPENYLSLSELLYMRGDRVAALETLKMATKYFPGDAIAFQNLAIFYLKTGNLEQAEKNFYKAIELDPAKITAYIGLSNIAQIQGKMEEVEGILDRAIAINPSSAEAYLAMAYFEENIGDPKQAEAFIKDALDIFPSDIRIHQSLGQFYLRRGRYQEALHTLRDTIELPGYKQGIYLDIGQVYMAMERYDEAQKWFKDAIPLDRSNPSPYIALADLYQSLEKWDETRNALETALSIQPTSIDALLALSDLNLRLARFDEAREDLEQAHVIDHGNVEVLIKLAEYYRYKGDLQEAISHLILAIETSPIYLPSYTALGQTFQIAGEYSLAKLVYSQGIQNCIDKQNAYLARADFYKSQAEWDLAQADYETAFHIAQESLPTGLKLARFYHSRQDYDGAMDTLLDLEERLGRNAQIKVEMGKVYAEQANWLEALKSYNEAVRIDGSLPSGYTAKAQIYNALGQYEKAIDIYKTAPNDVDIFINLGDISKSHGNYNDARAAYQSVLALEPYNTSALVKLDQLNRLMGLPEIDLEAFIDRANVAPTTEAFISLAQLSQLRGEWNAAYYWLQRAISLDQNDSDNWYHLGNYHRALEQWNKALEAYKTAREGVPTSPEVIIAIGAVQEELGMIEDALANYQQVIDIDPGNSDGYISLATLQYDLGQTELAIDTIQEGIVHSPFDYRTYKTYGDFYADLGKNALAEEVYQTGLKSIPGAADLYVSLGNLHTDSVLTARSKLDTAESLELLARTRIETLQEMKSTALLKRQKRVTELKLKDAITNYEKYRNRLVAAERVYVYAGSDFDAAVEYYQQALELQPNNEFALLGLGKLHLATGLTEDALNYFEQAVFVNPRSLLALSYLGNIYLELRRTEDAIDDFESMLDIDRSNLLAHLGISRAYQNLENIYITEAADAVEHGQFRMENLVEYFRTLERRTDPGF